MVLHPVPFSANNAQLSLFLRDTGSTGHQGGGEECLYRDALDDAAATKDGGGANVAAFQHMPHQKPLKNMVLCLWKQSCDAARCHLLSRKTPLKNIVPCLWK